MKGRWAMELAYESCRLRGRSRALGRHARAIARG